MEKVAKEVAEQEFQRFADSFEIDTNVDAMPADDAASFKSQRDRIVAQIVKGRATVGDGGNIIFRARRAADNEEIELTFRVPTGDAYIRMDNHKDRESVHKMFSFLGSMTGQPPKLFSALDGRDTRFCMGIASLFLGS